MTSVFLVDDHSVFRAGVKAELANAVDIVGEAGTVAEAVRGIERTRPDVVLLDVHMPDGGGLAVLKRAPGPAYLALSVSDAAEDVIALIRAGARGYVTKNIAGAELAEAVRGIERTRPDVVLLDVHMPDGGGLAVLKRAPGPAYLALSVSDAAEDVIALIRAGARGYVTKNIAGTELAEAIARVRGGDAYFSPRLAGFVLDAFASGPVVEEDDPAVDSLTRRELEVLRLLARGYTYKEIAERLFISVKTVETHASNILRKTQTSNRHQLTRWAVARDLG